MSKECLSGMFGRRSGTISSHLKISKYRFPFINNINIFALKILIEYHNKKLVKIS